MPVHILQPDGTYSPPVTSGSDDPTVNVGGGSDGYVRLASGVIVPATAAQGRTDLGLGTAATHPAGDFQLSTVTLDQVAAPAANVALASHKLTGVTDPTSAQDAATKAYADAQFTSPLSIAADAEMSSAVNSSAAVMTTALKPVFQPIRARGLRSYIAAQAAVNLTTLFAANTVGIAIYSVVYTDATHWTATLVAQLNAAASTATALLLKSDLTTGAAGSGAAPVTLDLVNNRYIIGSMCSDVTTAAFQGYSLTTKVAGLGYIQWQGTARSSTTDWPASFTEATTQSPATCRSNSHYLFTASGKNIP